MGVDYTPVSGVGIEVTKDIKKKLVMANGGDFDGCLESLLDDLELVYQDAGSGSYTGEENTYYLKVEGSTLTEINRNSEPFLKKLEGFGISLTVDDLIMINDLCVW